MSIPEDSAGGPFKVGDIIGARGVKPCECRGRVIAASSTQFVYEMAQQCYLHKDGRRSLVQSWIIADYQFGAVFVDDSFEWWVAEVRREAGLV